MSRGVTFLGEILSGFCPVPHFEGTRVTVTADKYCLVSNLILSFCGNLSFRSVFLSRVALILLLMRYFRLSYTLHYSLIQKQNFLSLYLLQFNLDSNCIFQTISNIRCVIHSTHFITFILSLWIVPVHLNYL